MSPKKLFKQFRFLLNKCEKILSHDWTFLVVLLHSSDSDSLSNNQKKEYVVNMWLFFMSIGSHYMTDCNITANICVVNLLFVTPNV